MSLANAPKRDTPDRQYVQDVPANNCSLRYLHFRHPWRSYAGFASLHGCNSLDNAGAYCRGAKTGYVQEARYAGFAGAKTGQVLVIACGALAHDLVRVKALNQWQHMDIQCLPAELHNHPQKIPAAVENKIKENLHKYQNIFVAYSDCGTGGLLDAVLQRYGIERLPGAHCYEMFAGKDKFRAFHEAELGTFYLTDFLATHFDRLIIKGLGLDRFPQLKTDYFGNYRKLLYLAQLDDMEIAQKARNAAQYLGLEYERVLTHDTHFESALSVQVGSVRLG